MSRQDVEYAAEAIVQVADKILERKNAEIERLREALTNLLNALPYGHHIDDEIVAAASNALGNEKRARK